MFHSIKSIIILYRLSVVIHTVSLAYSNIYKKSYDYTPSPKSGNTRDVIRLWEFYNVWGVCPCLELTDSTNYGSIITPMVASRLSGELVLETHRGHDVVATLNQRQ